MSNLTNTYLVLSYKEDRYILNKKLKANTSIAKKGLIGKSVRLKQKPEEQEDKKIYKVTKEETKTIINNKDKKKYMK